MQADPSTGIDHQRGAQDRHYPRLTLFVLLEENLHDQHILGSGRLQQGIFGIVEDQLVVVTEGRRINNLEGQGRLVE